MRKVNIGAWHSVLKLLDYSWKDIDYKYERLSAAEKKKIAKTDFNELVAEINLLKEEKKQGVVYS